MTDTEVFVFMETFRGLTRVFPFRGTDDEIRDVGARYFKALRQFTLTQVQAGAEVCLQRNKHFPKPAEWIDAIPRRVQAIDVPVLSDEDTRVYHRAEALRHEDLPCGCAACQEAHVEWKPLRFVPEVNPDGSDRKVKDAIRDRIVTAGHWAHGWELARYWQAKGEFYAKWHARFGQKPPIAEGRS
jgi:hypothetical protein